MAKSDFVGVDGCRGGWFSVGLNCQGSFAVEVFRSFDELLAHYSEARLVLVDIPIGLPDGPGERDCDREARRLLGPRRSSVFPTPTAQTVQRAAESPGDYRGALETERRIAGKGLSKQAFEIAPKIAEVNDALAGRGMDAKPEVREVHPELCFWALNGKRPMSFPKKRTVGGIERIRVLREREPRTQEIVDEALRGFLRRTVARDDILDALAAAVTACYGALSSKLRTVPAEPPFDSRGLPMEMVFLGE